MNETGEANETPSGAVRPSDALKRQEEEHPYAWHGVNNGILRVVSANNAQPPLANGEHGGNAFQSFAKTPSNATTVNSHVRLDVRAPASSVGRESFAPASKAVEPMELDQALLDYGSSSSVATGQVLGNDGAPAQHPAADRGSPFQQAAHHFDSLCSGEIGLEPFAGISVPSSSGQAFEFESMLSPSTTGVYGDAATNDVNPFDLPVLDDVEFTLTDESAGYKVRDQRRRHPTAPGSLLASSRPGNNLTLDFLNVFSLPPPPVARVPRKSRGKPDSIFSLLKKNGMTDSTKWSRARSCSLRHVDQATLMSPLGKSKSDEAVQKSGLPLLAVSATATGGSSRRHSTKSRCKPLPLTIPPYVFFNRFQSQLRSPSFGENHAVSIIDVHARTPYTPPPILSPLRRGSGLFCRIRRPSPVAPKSAPVSCSRQEFWNNVNSDNPLVTVTSQSDDFSPAIQSPPDSPVKTDSLPHINVGAEYQAVIPSCVGPAAAQLVDQNGTFARLVFNPECLQHACEEGMEAYLQLANSPAVHVGGTNTEMALHLLNDCGGDVTSAASRLLGTEPLFSVGHALYDYLYNDCSDWMPDEVNLFQQALCKSDKDFNEVATAVGSKSVGECVSFYYTWKTVFRKSYQTYRVAKQKKEYLQFEGAATVPSNASRRKPIIRANKLPTAKVVPKANADHSGYALYPCDMCGKVFYKVKSRSAHMKVHYKC